MSLFFLQKMNKMRLSNFIKYQTNYKLRQTELHKSLRVLSTVILSDLIDLI
jgi:hypothetical protein